MGSVRPRVVHRWEPSLADALFSKTQQRVLALLFGEPSRSFYASEIISRARGGSGAIQREITRLEASGLLITRRIGNQKHYQANTRSPLFGELYSIMRKTVGLAEPLRDALAPLAPRIIAAFVYGSVASQKDTAQSDIDLMIVSDRLTYGDLFKALDSVGRRLGREVSPTVYTMGELRKRMKTRNAFLTRVLKLPKIWLIGSERELATSA